MGERREGMGRGESGEDLLGGGRGRYFLFFIIAL